MRTPRFEWLLVVTVSLVLTVAMTWPLAPKIGRGGRIDSGDGQQSIWNVAWVAHALVTNPRGLFDANIYHPHRNTLAFLEPNVFTGALAVPGYLATRNPFVAHNSVALLTFFLALVGTYGLVRHLTGHRGAAAVSAVSFAFCPYVFTHSAHIQLLMTAGLPFGLWMMHRFVERRTAGRAIVLGLVVGAEALSCGYYGIFLALMLVPGMVYYAFARGLWREPRYWIGAAGAGLLAILVVLPFFWNVLELQRTTGFSRGLQESARWVASWRSYLASPAHAHRWLVPKLGLFIEALYPGTVAVVLGAVGLFIGWTRKRRAPGHDHIVFYTALAILACWASAGPRAGLYTLLYHAIPVFSLLHAPSRIGLLTVLALIVLAGFAVAWLLERRRHASLIAAGLVVLALADLDTAPLYMVEFKPLPEAYKALARQPAGPVLEMPFFYRRIDFPRHAEYMLYSTFHWHPLVNGYTDYIPPDFREMAIPVSSFPNPESFAIVRQLGVRYVVFHVDFYARVGWKAVNQRIDEYKDYLKPISKEGSIWLFEIVAWPPPS
jgi:hypothetical protein